MKNYFHPHYLNVLYIKFVSLIWKIINYSAAYWWKIIIGKKNAFHGKTIFRTLPGGHIKIGSNCIFNSSYRSNLIGVHSPCILATITKEASIEIGNSCGFSGTQIGCAKYIKIGNNVRCGANTLITDSDWHFDDSRTGPNCDVIIEDNVWLGYGVTVLKGVIIGKNSLIGAGSIVTKNIPANVIAAGNPCKVIKRFNEK